ncbi:MAG: DOPA 4,5-dioxygenase family protein [Sneathiellales bacterium]|nr:DOPA 4,5-dioxygenase family protein [Sneathiellales bacterium]
MAVPISSISAYHAHIYYSAKSKDKAIALRTDLDEHFDVQLGRMHDTPVGPHLSAMYLVVFGLQEFDKLVPWLMLNRNGLDILIHPETGNDLEDHSDHAMWLGDKLDLDWSRL